MAVPIAATAWEIAQRAKDEAFLTRAYESCRRNGLKIRCGSVTQLMSVGRKPWSSVIASREVGRLVDIPGVLLNHTQHRVQNFTELRAAGAPNAPMRSAYTIENRTAACPTIRPAEGLEDRRQDRALRPGRLQRSD